MTVLTTPYALGAGGQVLSGKLLRLALGATFLPGAGVTAVSGVLAGPPNTMGELSLVSNTQLTVQPFRAVVQCTQDATAGQYVVPNDAAVTLAVPAQDGSQYRRALVVVSVADSQVAGVASTAATDNAALQIITGALNASAGGAALPPVPANSLVLGELLIPPTGQTVQVTPYNPRTGLRGAILPVIDSTSTRPGHAGAPGRYVGEYRDHPVRGLERWDGNAWRDPHLDKPIARFLRVSPGSVAVNTFVPITFDTLVIDSPGGQLSANGQVLIAPKAGHYRISAMVGLAGATAGGRGALRLNRVGTNGADVAALRIGALAYIGGSIADPTVHATGTAYFAAGEGVRAYIFQDSGVTRNTTSADFAPTGIEWEYLRP